MLKTNTNESIYEINNSKITQLSNTNLNEQSVTYQETPCSLLKPGDIVVVEKNQRIPADLVILKTLNLDG